MLGSGNEAIDQACLQSVPENEQHRCNRHQHHQRIKMKGGKQCQCDIHRDGHHLAMSEIDYTYHPENHR